MNLALKDLIGLGACFQMNRVMDLDLKDLRLELVE